MNIAIIVCAFPPYKGGMGNAAFEQAKQLVKLGNKVVVFTPKYNHEQKRYEEILGIKVSRLTPVFKYGNGAFLPQLFWKLKDYDAVFLHYPFFGGAEVVWLRRILHIGSTAPVATGDYGAVNSIFKAKWPKHNPKLIKDDIINLVVQINGKLRDTIEAPVDISEKEAQKIALESDKIKKWIADKDIIKVIFVKGKLVNIVIK